MRHLLAIMLLILGVAAASAQEGGSGAAERATCGLTSAQATGIGALRLGMTPEQVLALFPGSKEDPEVRSGLSKPASPYGESGFQIKPGKYQSEGKFAGISRIKFLLLDGRVSSFFISYDGPEWSHVDQFVAKVAEGAGLPAVDAWEAYVGLDTQLKILKCTDFEVRVFAGGQGGNLNYVLVSDLEAARALQERRAKAKEKMRQEHKP